MIVILCVMSLLFGESSSSVDKFISLKGNMNASKVYSTQAAFGSVSAKTLYSSLRLRSNSVAGSKVSTIETVTPLIKVPTDSNGVRFYCYNFFSLSLLLTFVRFGTGFGARGLRLGNWEYRISIDQDEVQSCFFIFRNR